MIKLVRSLRAAAHLDRLRILGLCAHADLTVCELAEVLALPREHVIGHVRQLARAGFLLGNEQRPWPSYHLEAGGSDGGLVQLLVDLLPHGDGHHRQDLLRLEAIQGARSKVTACLS
ncbi:MAG: winged helix-turn-helix transcriptional regulator [Mesorhizobium sp.]|nr:ArsR family transcriptional regulator [Mesorhizobium sp. M5C.F.Ca.IN.020.29.1.1]RWA97253.1 MAG: ArsR family transcriptional regulator [Mesorhizobium sp.]TGT92805.1 ArsR family transcriptional regulator [Mesorhizobium sp. M5C.F.Ca.ET.164.01.1.1]RWC24200.1 MAG: ArsR family transcriptional regulator [Mesorhizobium sp.]RWD76790.1 MAG: ArsR family transcriptional regulator [Mesorhizobium sp.]